MCKVHNSVGCLTTLKTHLNKATQHKWLQFLKRDNKFSKGLFNFKTANYFKSQTKIALFAQSARCPVVKQPILPPLTPKSWAGY
jgi:hypothetical protein